MLGLIRFGSSILIEAYQDRISPRGLRWHSLNMRETTYSVNSYPGSQVNRNIDLTLEMNETLTGFHSILVNNVSFLLID